MNVFILNQIKLETSHYPLRKTREDIIGVYSSLDKTYEALQAYVANEWYKRYEKKYTMGFIVYETKLDDKLTWGISIHTYTKAGEPNDELLRADEEYPDGDKPFYGRPKEKIRFKPGDIVEVYQGNESELSIICHTTLSTEEFEEYKVWWEERGDLPENGTHFDSTDDCYLTYSIGIGDTHNHPEAAYVFAPTRKVPAKLEFQLQAKLIEENYTGGHDLQISELPFAKDPEILDEVLNIWEKVVETKDYAEMRCLTIREKGDWIKAELNFSEKQSQRFDRIYEECIRLVNEEQENRTKK